MTNFAGKVAFVTVAANGIGRATALGFAREGANVVLADISEQGNQETLRLIEQQGGRAVAVRCDVSRAQDVNAAMDKTVEAFGQLDFAFNNAGIEPKKAAPTAEYDEEEWSRIIDINLRGMFLCMKHEIPLILKQGGGAIVNTSSGAGIIGIKGSPAYTAAKHGVIGLTRSAALDYAAKNIRINAVCPGYIDTPMMDRFTGGTPEGRAKVIAEEPADGWGNRKRLQQQSSGCARTWQPSRLATQWSLTEARRCSDGRHLASDYFERMKGENYASRHCETLAWQVREAKEAACRANRQGCHRRARLWGRVSLGRDGGSRSAGMGGEGL
jgi:NAD(P)-dependent dehydrogenase (short-subunit alcohol dehydrogenase family)